MEGRLLEAAEEEDASKMAPPTDRLVLVDLERLMSCLRDRWLPSNIVE